MESLEDFVEKIDNFNFLKPAHKIQFFSYYVQEVKGLKPFKAKNIEECFTSLHVKVYSNVGSFLNKNSSGKNHLYIKSTAGYTLERNSKEQIAEKIGQVKIKKPSNNLYPIELFKDTRGYLESVASQASVCYDFGQFDACSVMIRKLLETLIIEVFEKNKLESKIKNSQGHYNYLSDLITEFVNQKDAFKIGRNTIQSLPKLKKLGDLSAHNRRYVAKKPDIENIKDDIRIILEELVHLIDYKNWKT